MNKENSLQFQSYWPEEQAADLLLDTAEIRLGILEAEEIEPGASLLVWAANSLETLLGKLGNFLESLPRPLYTKVPGQENKVKEITAYLSQAGFAVLDMHLDMRLNPIPDLAYPGEVLSGPKQNFTALAAIDAAVFPLYQQTAEELRSNANSKAGAVLSINVDDKPAGLIVGEIYGPNLDQLFVRSIAVLPEYRGRGLGKKLLIALLAWGRQRGANRSMLWLSDVYNKPARCLYESFGYQGKKVEAEMVLK